ncbi:hypothetical protein [Vibrio owensii]|uniref:hypothetical protein n=1 Tax=Vibrio harveyi group TaxID=717610 RepID=UPI003CC63BD5
MVNLIITVIAIAFFAAIMYAGSGYINFDSVINLKQKTEVTASLSQLNTGISSYRLLYDSKPETWSDITPSIIGKPTLPATMQWGDLSLNGATGYNQACITASIERQTNLDTLISIQSEIGSDLLVIGDACGDTTDLLPDTYPSIKVITYTIR